MPADDAFDLGPVPTRITVTEELTRRLVSAQFPQWADLPVEPMANGGWDNWTFHLGTEMVVRLPSASEYAQAVEKEHRWLPALAPNCRYPSPSRWRKASRARNTHTHGRSMSGSTA